MSTAQVTVISSPELLELTLAKLPMRDLLVTAPLVCKTWQAITLTPALQRLLFFQPDTSSDRAENPLLVELFPPFFAPGGPIRWSWPDSEAIESMPWSKAPDAFKRAEASWRRMLVTQPPAQRLVITEQCHARGGDSVARAVLDDPCLRMGVLYDLVLPFIDRPASSFCIRWLGDSDGRDVREEITLEIAYTEQQCTGNWDKYIPERFYSDAAETVRVKFGESVEVPWEVAYEYFCNLYK
ncbi:F-box domain protein [Mycena sanguinolenta]|uniref:F-box domain protein n=1 Tax=Mycena sanguinolenta TaxID=230812 RepID=A0A8H6ZGD5_9AGAR|nr:F-box domain protein [Mycena sanguinolenta]